MKISRNRAPTPNINSLSAQISGLHGPCVGCQNCTGICQALIDALVLPDLILNKTANSQ